MTEAAPIGLYILGAGVLAFLVWSMVREIRTALRQDREENTTKHLTGKVKEYAVVIGVCVVGYLVVVWLKDGPLQGISQALWGSPTETTQGASPFYQDVR